MAYNKPKKPEPLPAPMTRMELKFEVTRLLCGLVPHPEIKAQLAKRCDASESEVQDLINTVYSEWAAHPSVDREASRTQVRNALSKLYGLAIESGKLREALRALEEICKLDGLYAPKKLEVSQPHDEKIESRDPSYIRSKIREILAKHPEMQLPEPEKGPGESN